MKRNLSGEDPLSNQKLIERASQGDQAAWVELVRQHGEGVFRYAYLKVGDAQTAEDMAQETFVRAYRALERFDTHKDLRPWLLTIAANLSRNWLRDRARYLRAVQRWALETTERHEDRTRIHDDEINPELLWEEIRQLPAQDQDVIYLRFFMELSVEETADVIGVPEGTVKSRTHRALARLRGRLLRAVPDMIEEA